MDTPSEILGPEGPFARLIPDFLPRPEQQEMADAVAAALEDRSWLIAEAGTGTGKTFAYLVPALLSGRKVIISTGTRNLQDQLFHKDLPLVRKALGVTVDAVLLKGRANYLCPHRLELALEEGRFRNRGEAAALVRLAQWAGITQSGDIAEFGELAEDALLWVSVTSNSDNCLGQECPHIGGCFLAKARRRALEADVVVINHHLLFADMSLRDEGVGELLPAADAFVLDEAHQLPEVASNFFGLSLSGNQLLELARDTLAEDRKAGAETGDVAIAVGRLDKATRELRLAFGEEPRRGPWRAVSGNRRVREAIDSVSTALAELHSHLEPQAVRSQGLENCLKRCEGLSERFALLTGEAPEDHIHWFETYRRSFSFNLTPLEVASVFREQLDARPRAWVFASATLSVDGGFAHFQQALGLEESEARRWESPFDFQRQALCYLPPGMPEPADPRFTAVVVERALPVLAASGGRAFLLFTSHRALQEAADRLSGQIDYPLLVQGSAPRERLLERFRTAGNAVLLGTGSFWEGVDVRGDALSCVIIDKLPFASPGDPVLQARIDAMRRRGGNPFFEHQLPQAVITLKQGVGRLIRDVTDRGVLMLCDPRLVSKPYGRVFLESLPSMRRTDRFEEVERFLDLS